ncbi:alanine:cation symporter family protein [Mariniblastus sp.]|jgi:alanine or glycine:cation symporter, AGCS family|nr:alanine/glycine:cation symporter family protein [Mariniblastus sp.]MDB4756310.1 alanine:cation symporter family protein [Mariniblastus sp.]
MSSPLLKHPLRFTAILLFGFLAFSQILAAQDSTEKSGAAKSDSKQDLTEKASSTSQKTADAPESSPQSVGVATGDVQDEWFDNTRWYRNFDDQPGSVFDPFDRHFGDVVVKPVEGVFFYDLYYWDNAEADVFGVVSNLKTAITDSQKELKKVRQKLGLDPATPANPNEENSENQQEKTAGDSSATASDLIELRNQLKSSLKNTISALVSSKTPSEELQKIIIAIKKPFFDLDFQVRQSEDQKITKSQMVDVVEAITEPVGSLSRFTGLSKDEIARSLAGISDKELNRYLRGYDKDKVAAEIDLYEKSADLEGTLNSLVAANSLSNADGEYKVSKKEDADGKMVDVGFTAISVPFIVLWLVLGAIFFTLRMSFINIRGFRHAIKVTKGDYDDPSDPGEISHFQALSSALSATVGLGNIAGVAIAVSLGGPGALVWMIIAGFLGMSSKFTECTLGQMYRNVDERGQVLGGPMRYLSAGLSEMKLGMLGKLLAVMFVILCIGGSFGGGNMFQANQSYAAVKGAVPWFEGKDWLYGLILAFVVGLVILGGIKRIGTAAGVIVPFMCLIYVAAATFVIIVNYTEIPAAFGTMLGGAFSLKAGMGGLIGTLVVGFQRAAFSNEAGTGSASIAHSAAATDEPVREGIVALLEPFIDTIVVCTMTGLVVVITKAYEIPGVNGVEMTSEAFKQGISWFPYVLSVAVVLFAFSTMISWSYYGERCAIWLFGPSASIPYKIVFLIFVFLGSVLNLGNVLGFSDLMILGMAFPNILGLLLLSGKVRRGLDEYWQKLETGAFDKNEQKSDGA